MNEEQRILLILQYVYNLMIHDDYKHTDTPYTDNFMDTVIYTLSYKLSRGMYPDDSCTIKDFWDLADEQMQQYIVEELTKHYNICYEVVEI